MELESNIEKLKKMRQLITEGGAVGLYTYGIANIALLGDLTKGWIAVAGAVSLYGIFLHYYREGEQVEDKDTKKK